MAILVAVLAAVGSSLFVYLKTKTPNNAQTRLTNAAPRTRELKVNVAGPGQELIGQSGIDNNLKITITGVDRYSPLLVYDGKAVQTQGVFLVVSYEMENIGTKPNSYIVLSAVDGKGRQFSSTLNMFAITAVSASGVYKSDLLIQPGLKGQDYKVLEVPADATNFKLKLGF